MKFLFEIHLVKFLKSVLIWKLVCGQGKKLKSYTLLTEIVETEPNRRGKLT